MLGYSKFAFLRITKGDESEMPAKPKVVPAGKPVKANLSGDGRDSGSSSDLRGGGPPKGGDKIPKPSAKKKG
jgi:hypothetical protein